MMNRLGILRAAGVIALALPVAVAKGAGPVRDLVQENRLTEALTICRQYESLPTADQDNFYACAWAYFRSAHVQSAERMMEPLKKNASAAEYRLLEAYGKIAHKQYDEAKRLLKELGEEHPSGPLGIAIQEVTADLYEAMGQPDTAAFIYKQIVNDDPTRARAQWGLGRYYLARNEVDKARAYLEATARLWPRHVGSRYNLAVLCLAQEQFTEAARWLTECYRLDRSDSGVLEQMGLLFEKKGKVSDAVKYWRRAVEYNKDATIAKAKLAQYTTQGLDSLLQAGRFDEALAQTEKPPLKNDPAVRLRRAMALKGLGKYTKAIPELLAYLKSNPNDAVGFRELGICYLNAKLADKAGAAFQRASEINPANGMNFAWMGFILEHKGKLAEAREAWKKAVELLTDPAESKKASRRLATVEKRLGSKEDEARENRKKRAGSEPDLENDIESQDVLEGVEGISHPH